MAKRDVTVHEPTFRAVRTDEPAVSVPRARSRIPWLRIVASVVAIVVVVMVPAATADPFVLSLCVLTVIWALWGISLNLVWGVAGLFSMAQVALGAVSSYVFAVLIASSGWDIALAALAGLVGSVLVSLVIGLVALRLQAFRFAIMTLAFALAITGIAGSLEIAGGATGLGVVTPLPSITVGSFTWNLATPAGYYALAALVLCGSLIAQYVLLKRPVGRRLLAMREDEVLASSMGIPVPRLRLFAFAVGGFFSGLAGLAQAVYFHYISPDLYSIETMLTVILIVVLGGRGYLLAPVVGAAIYVVLANGIQISPSYQLAVYGVVVIAIIILRPDGISGLTDTLIRKARRRWWPKAGPAATPTTPARRRMVRDVSGEVNQRPPATVPILVGVDLAKRYGGVAAVAELDIEIRSQEVLGIIGPNGAGKTSLFNLLSGFAVPDQGRVELNGHDVTSEAPYERAARGLVRTFQQSRVYGQLTVRSNILVAAQLQHRVDPFERAEAVLEQFGLTDLAEVRGAELSYGIAKRASLAAAVATGAELFLLDEPAAGLNDVEIAELADDIEWLRSAGASVCIVEHHMDFVMSSCDRIVVMDAGRVIADGTPEQVVGNAEVINAYLGVDQ